ncbi:FadR/GntR family transcriptional regulator [Patulibacter defluvii]|uniref:FadR/GntR family transcriptional regulator n=1 Tax=Patulibacter defluvii TaxID=3095358 RepID=UPI002A74ABF4|nr:FCD domain-containing protein [Patulibacter sp. DM4]
MDDTPFTAPQQVQSAPQQIASSIKQSILDGQLKPGDRLPSEERLAAMFGVSRPTAREALRTLRADHVLVSSRGRTGGYRVAEMSLRALGSSVAEVISLSLSMRTLTYAQLFEVRHALELLSAASAAEHRSAEDLLRLEAALPGGPPLDPDAALAADLAFHAALADCTHNPLIIGFVDATSTAFRRFSDEARGIDPQLLFGHLDAVVEAVEARDPAAAEAAMRRHLEYFARYFELA